MAVLAVLVDLRKLHGGKSMLQSARQSNPGMQQVLPQGGGLRMQKSMERGECRLKQKEREP